MRNKRSCKNYCRFAKYCYQKGEPGLDPDDCPTAWKIEDLIDESKYPDTEEDEHERTDG